MSQMANESSDNNVPVYSKALILVPIQIKLEEIHRIMYLSTDHDLDEHVLLFVQLYQLPEGSFEIIRNYIESQEGFFKEKTLVSHGTISSGATKRVTYPVFDLLTRKIIHPPSSVDFEYRPPLPQHPHRRKAKQGLDEGSPQKIKKRRARIDLLNHNQRTRCRARRERELPKVADKEHCSSNSEENYENSHTASDTDMIKKLA